MASQVTLVSENGVDTHADVPLVEGHRDDGRLAWAGLALTLFRTGYQLGWLTARLGGPGPQLPEGETGPLTLEGTGLLETEASALKAAPAVTPAAPVAAAAPAALVPSAPLTPALAGAAAAGAVVAPPPVAAAAAPPRAGVSGLSLAALLPWLLFTGGVLIYAFTRLFRLDAFPIYFFADEAIETVLARDLVRNGFRDPQGNLLPVFFNTYGFFNPLISVYFHAISTSLFGTAVEITRATSAVVTITGAVAVALALKWVYKIRLWWAAPLFLALIPAWFIHSRTAFETAMMVTFYVWTLFFYLMYRYRSPYFIFPTLIFAAMTFYSYGNGQIVIGVSGLLLALSDLRYHLKNWRVLLPAALVVGLVALPYIEWRATHPNEIAYHLRTLDAFWFRDVPVSDKIAHFIGQYVYMLTPAYWFNPNVQELVRHVLKGYGHIMPVTLPLFLVGVGVALWRIRESAYRLVFIAALASPVGGALTGIGITRVLAFVIPATIFMTLGTDFLIGLLARLAGRRRLARWAELGAAAVVFVALAWGNLAMLNDALTNGPLWFRDYGLYGMQWGARQLFAAAQDYLRASPNDKIMLTSTWANGTDVFLRYFTPDEPRITGRNVDSLMERKQALDPSMIFIMTPEERRRAEASKKFKPIEILRTLPYPDGSDGFYFARLAYVDNVDQVFQVEREARRQPVTGQVLINGQTVSVTHAKIGAGQLKDLFDGDPFTLVRGEEANPIYFEFTFPTPRSMTAFRATLGSMDPQITVSLYAPGATTPTKTYTQSYRNLPTDPTVEMPLPDAPPEVQKARIEVKDMNQGETAKIHLREFVFK